MADSNVPITAGSGTNIDTRTNTGGEHRQVVVLGNDGDTVAKVNTSGDVPMSITNPTAHAAGLFAGVTGYGFLRATDEPTALFMDPIDGALDTLVRWTTSGTVTPTVGSGELLVNPASATSASSALTSKPTFSSRGVNFLGGGWMARFETISGNTTGTNLVTNNYRFMGFGNPSSTPSATYSAGNTTTNTMLDAIGFEVDTDGGLYAVVYQNGTRTRPFILGSGSVTNLLATRNLADGKQHQFAVVIRTDAIFWYIDGTDIPAATFNYKTASPTYVTPNVQTLPLRFSSINAGSAPAQAPLLQVSAVGVGDTGKNASSLSDPKFPWRQARVGSDGGLKVGSGRDVIFDGYAATWRVQGTATSTINLFSMENTSSSTITVGLRRLAVDISSNASAYVIPSYIRMWRGTTVPTGGTTLTKHSTDSTQTSAATVILRGPASADGTATAITYATPAGTPMRSQAVPTAMTAVGQWLTDDLDMWKYDFPPLVLRAGESILVAHHGGNSGTGLGYTVKACWEEFTAS